MAVPLFMLISGYVYTKSFLKNDIVSMDSAYNKKYFIKNFIRYTIPYIIMNFIEISVKIIIAVKNNKSINHLIKSSVGLFLQGGDGPGSYYYPEMIQIMFLFPIIYLLVKKYDFKGVLVVASVTLLLEVMKYPYFVNEGQYRLLLFRYFMLLAFGAYFAFKKMQAKFWIFSVIGFSFIIIFKYTNYSPIIFKWWTGTSMFPALFIVPIFGFIAEKNIKIFILEKIGKASYNIFLTQMAYYLIMYGKVKEEVENIYLNTFISTIICVIIGMVFYKIEYRITKKVTTKILRVA